MAVTFDELIQLFINADPDTAFLTKLEQSYEIMECAALVNQFCFGYSIAYQ